MKRSSRILILLIGLLAAPNLALAGSATSSFSVTASVSNNCTISTTTVAFGAYDPIVANATSPLDSTGSVTITCTKGAATTIGLNTGSNSANASGSTRAMASGSNFLSYELYQDTGRSVVWGNSGAGLFTPAAAPSKSPRAFTVYGRVAGGQDAAGGSYSDTVVATVNF